jgi:uncharacterized membrane protein
MASEIHNEKMKKERRKMKNKSNKKRIIFLLIGLLLVVGFSTWMYFLIKDFVILILVDALFGFLIGWLAGRLSD